MNTEKAKKHFNNAYALCPWYISPSAQKWLIQQMEAYHQDQSKLELQNALDRLEAVEREIEKRTVMSQKFEKAAMDTNYNPTDAQQSEQLHSCKYVKRVGEGCTLNNNCKYPNCP